MLAGRIGFIDAIQVLLLPLLAGRNLADSAEDVSDSIESACYSAHPA